MLAAPSREASLTPDHPLLPRNSQKTAVRHLPIGTIKTAESIRVSPPGPWVLAIIFSAAVWAMAGRLVWWFAHWI